MMSKIGGESETFFSKICVFASLLIVIEEISIFIEWTMELSGGVKNVMK